MGAHKNTRSICEIRGTTKKDDLGKMLMCGCGRSEQKEGREGKARPKGKGGKRKHTQRRQRETEERGKKGGGFLRVVKSTPVHTKDKRFLVFQDDH